MIAKGSCPETSSARRAGLEKNDATAWSEAKRRFPSRSRARARVAFSIGSSRTAVRQDPSRGRSPERQASHTDQRGNDARQMQHGFTHQTEERIAIRPGHEGTDIRMHDAVQNRMRQAARETSEQCSETGALASHRRRGASARREELGRTDRQDAEERMTRRRRYQANRRSADQRVEEAMHRILLPDQIVERLAVDQHRRDSKGGP